MKDLSKLLSVVLLIGVVASFSSCKDDEDKPSDWPESAINDAENSCVENGDSREACECYVGKLSQELSFNEFSEEDEENTTEVSEEEFNAGLDQLVRLLVFAEECGVNNVFSQE